MFIFTKQTVCINQNYKTVTGNSIFAENSKPYVIIKHMHQNDKKTISFLIINTPLKFCAINSVCSCDGRRTKHKHPYTITHEERNI